MFSEIQVFKCFLCVCAANDTGRKATGGPPQELDAKQLVYIYKIRAIEQTRKLASLAIITIIIIINNNNSYSNNNNSNINNNNNNSNNNNNNNSNSNNINNNNTQIAAIALPPSTTHPQLWAELLTFKPKCTSTYITVRSKTRPYIHYIYVRPSFWSKGAQY